MEQTESLHNLSSELMNKLESVNTSISILISAIRSTMPQQIEESEQRASARLCRSLDLRTMSESEQSEELSSKCKVLTNKSKFLNDEQRKRVIEYITDHQEQEVIKALQPHKRVSYIQKQLKEKYNITLSFYHASNIIKTYII